jgi:chorismate synthase
MGDVDEAKADRDTVGGVVEVRARGVPPGLGSYATKEERLDARLAAALMGIQAVKGVEIGEGFALAGMRGSQAHDEILPGFRRETNRAGGIEGGVSNGEEIVVRAAMKPLPTLMRPLRSVDLVTGEPGEALVERSDTAAVEALSVVAEASVAFELARAAPISIASRGNRSRPPHRAYRVHGRGENDDRRSRRGSDRPTVHRPRP